TMTVAPAALEGRLPEAQDFANGAILLAGMKGAGLAVGRLRSIYAQTGIRPEQVVADAKADPTIAAEIAAPLPEAPLPEAPPARGTPAADPDLQGLANAAKSFSSFEEFRNTFQPGAMVSI